MAEQLLSLGKPLAAPFPGFPKEVPVLSTALGLTHLKASKTEGKSKAKEIAACAHTDAAFASLECTEACILPFWLMVL